MGDVNTTGKFIFLDTHAHLYPCHDPAIVLESLVARAAQVASGARPAMVLLESRGDPVFRRWRDGSGERFRRHPPRATDEKGLWFDVASSDGVKVRVYGGRQIRCSGRLEVVALGALPDVEDGMSVDSAVRAALDRGALAVLPWGAGKWLGARARPVLQALGEFSPGQLLLGDSSLRPRGWPLPEAMRAARREGRGILAGSDPLPCAGDAARVGCYGSLLPVRDGIFPDARALCAALGKQPPSWRNAGKRCGPMDFVLRQTAGFRGRLKRKYASPNQ